MLRKSLFAVLALIVMLTVCACGDKEKTDAPDASQNVSEDVAPEINRVQPEDKPFHTKEEIETHAAAALEKLSVIPEYPAGYPTLDDVVAQYKKTCEAVGWIVGTELVATDSDYTYMAHDLKYCRVLPDCYLGSSLAGDNPEADMLIYNTETLEAYFATLMDSQSAHDYVLDISESFEVPRFIQNKDGELYALPYAFPAAGYDEEDTFELIPDKDGNYILKVHYNTLDDNDEVDGRYVYEVKYVKENGRWVFKNFILVKQH